MMGMILVSLMPILRLVGTLWMGRLLRHRRPRWAYWSLSNIHIPYRVGVWPLERISHLSRRRRIMEPKKRICLILAALLSLSGVLPAGATDYQASDYLPLAVGNSWTYSHEFSDNERRYGDRSRWTTFTAQFPDRPQFTITVERTEVIDGKTYYVLSDMPANWPPAPPHFIAGKKLRWEGTRLMERTADGEQAIFRFDGTSEDYTPLSDPAYGEMNLYETKYAIPTEEGDNQVKVEAYLDSPLYAPSYSFRFLGNGEGSRSCSFRAGYGCSICAWSIFGEDHRVFGNRVKALRSVIGGTQVEYLDAVLISTSTSSSSWGQIKQSLLAGERRDQ